MDSFILTAHQGGWMEPDNRNELILLLARHLAVGKLESKDVLPVIRQLLGEPTVPLSKPELLDALRRHDSPAVNRLKQEVQKALLRDAYACHCSRRTSAVAAPNAWPDLAHLPLNAPLDWQGDDALFNASKLVLLAIRHLSFLRGRTEALPHITAEIEKLYQEAAGRIAAHPSRWRYLSPDLASIPECRGGLYALPTSGTGGGKPLPYTATTEISEYQELKERIEAAHPRMIGEARQALDQLSGPTLSGVDEDFALDAIQERYETAHENREEQTALLDLILTWPTSRVARAILHLCREEWEQERAGLILMLRFGKSDFQSWNAWVRWLTTVSEQAVRRNEEFARIKQPAGGDVLLFWYSQQENPAPEILNRLGAEAVERARTINPETFVEHWRDSMLNEEIGLLLGVSEPPPLPPSLPQSQIPPLLPEPLAVPPVLSEETLPIAKAPPLSRARRETPPVVREEPEKPSVWGEHVQPFLDQNWHMAAGLAMVVLGASLLAYFTWDKHWIFRNTIMPGLLALLTIGLAKTGSWLEARATALKGTGAMLRGAAICLLPVNFVAVALLSRDPEVTVKSIAVPGMALIYVLLFGWLLRRWCFEVHPSLGVLQGWSLLFLNALVALGPIASLLRGEGAMEIHVLLGIGFHLGFFGLMTSVWLFARRVLTPELVAERRVPWFFVSTMAVTFLQVFGLVHWTMGYLPKPATYATLVVLSGSVILFVERRFIELRAVSGDATGRSDPLRYAGESFIGFALVLLGVLMGMRDPHLRILVFMMAGVVWLYQASSRPGPLHYWIGLTLLMLCGASVGLLEHFPKSREANRLPELGIALAVAFGALRIVARRLGEQRLALAAVEFQPVVLVLTAAVSVLSQWRYRSEPLETGGALMVIAALFAWRAHRVQRLGWTHTAMALLALSLPYLGCVDMEGHSLHGNTMTLGLGIVSALWLLFIWLRPTPLLLQARSTVLWTYGGLALAAMLVRVMIERDTQGDIHRHWVIMDYTGPYLMALVLLITAYHSRSLIPTAMAAIILAVLFPELKARFKEMYPLISWGSGLGSACSALLITLLGFPLKRWSLLKNLEGGDLFLGKAPFPGRRRDHTIFTIPLLATAVFLIARVDTWTLLQRMAHGGVGIKTAVALGITGAVWTLLAAHLREGTFARMMVHFGWVAFLLAFHFGNKQLAVDPQLQIPLLCTGLLLQALYIVYGSLVSRHEWIGNLLLAPTHKVLRRGSLLIAWITFFYLFGRGDLIRVQWLGAFLLLQLTWHAVSSGKTRHGSAVFALVLIGLLAWVAPGRDVLPARLAIGNALEPVLWLALGVQLVQLLLETRTEYYTRLRGLLLPFQMGSIFLVLMSSFVGLREMLGASAIALTPVHQVLLIFALMLAARANRSGELALVMMLMAYLFIHTVTLKQIATADARLLYLFTPWRSAVLALSMVLLAHLGRWIHGRSPALLGGPYGVGASNLPPLPWIFVPATALVAQAVFYHTIEPTLRMAAIQLWAPYLGAITLALIACCWRNAFYPVAAGIVLCMANVHAVNVFAGKFLDERGLSDIHVVCLGLVFTLLQGTLARFLLKSDALVRRLNQGSTALAATVLVLLAFNYFVHPDLSTITAERFVISGLLSLAAARYFRQAARHPGPGEERFVDGYEGLYHFGVSMAIWCAMLLIPDLRHPSTALLALGVPAIYFYLKAELGLHANNEDKQTTAARYRNSAGALGFLLLGLYVFRAAFQMILFPGERVVTDHYHYNAPIIMLLAFLLFRLHGLGGTWWLAFYGGLALMTGAYFSVTSWPGFSPFEHPIPAAWVIVALSHLLIAGSHQGSPLRSVLQEMGQIEGAEWLALRRYWGRCLLAASQVVVLLGILDHRRDSYQVAPLLAGAASIFIHQGILGKIRWYLVAAAIQLTVALHADFIVPSHLDKEDVIWVVLGLWAVLALGYPLWRRWLTPAAFGPAAMLLFAGGMAHVFYHHPSSPAGLWAVALMTILGALTPRETRNPATGEQGFVAGLLLAATPWLVYFSQARIRECGISVALEAWPALATAVSLFVTGALVRVYQEKGASFLQEIEIPQPRLYHHALSLFEQFGDRIHLCLLWITFVTTSLLMASHYERAFESRELAACCLLWAGSAVAWFREGRDRAQIAPNVMAQLSVFALFIAIRRHLMLTTGFWNYEYDVWTSLAVSCCLTGAKRLIGRQSRELRVSLMGSLLVLPVVSMTWTLIHNLGPDVTLTVVGLHSLMFSFLGKDDRESPYNIIAIGGFVVFVLILFWTKLELHALHAYVIPVGMGILVLLQLFGRQIERDTRNRIRLVTLLAMLSSTGYYALMDDNHPMAFNITLLLLCLASMALGSFFRIRLYLVLGFTGLLVTLTSIFCKVVARLDTTYRMTSIGLLLLLLGIGLVAGSAYYKTHHEEFEQKLNRARARLGEWE